MTAEYVDSLGCSWVLKSSFLTPEEVGDCGTRVLQLYGSKENYKAWPVNYPSIGSTGLSLRFNFDVIFFAREKEALYALSQLGWRRLVEIDLENRERVLAFKREHPNNSWSYSTDRFNNNERICLYTRAILASLDDTAARLALELFYSVCDPYFAFERVEAWPQVSEIVQAAKMAVL